MTERRQQILDHAHRTHAEGRIVSVCTIALELGMPVPTVKTARQEFIKAGLWHFPTATAERLRRSREAVLGAARAIESEGRAVTGLECSQRTGIAATWVSAIARDLAKAGLWPWPVTTSMSRKGERAGKPKPPKPPKPPRVVKVKAAKVDPMRSARVLEFAEQIQAGGEFVTCQVVASLMGVKVGIVLEERRRLLKAGLWPYPDPIKAQAEAVAQSVLAASLAIVAEGGYPTATACAARLGLSERTGMRVIREMKRGGLWPHADLPKPQIMRSHARVDPKVRRLKAMKTQWRRLKAERAKADRSPYAKDMDEFRRRSANLL